MTIETDIVAWALERPGWQQQVLAALANGDSFDATQVEELVDEILAGTSAAPSQEAKGISVKSAVVEQVQLTAIGDVSGVNALVDGQRLDFAPTGLTVIYGDNGSGKSGYARLVKAMVGARHRAQILPDVFEDAPDKPSAVLHFSIAGTEQQSKFPAPPTPELLKMTFYDEHCGDEYLTRESTISYRPSALTLLDGLIETCDRVRAAISERIGRNVSSVLDLGLPPTTTAGAFVAALTSTTTEAQIDAATALPPSTNELLAVVLQEEARLLASDSRKEKTRLVSLASQVNRIADDLSHLLDALSTGRTAERRASAVSAVAAREAANVAATNSFDNEPLAGIGSETWRALWNGARTYSITEAYHEHDFPVTHDGAVCVFCQQPLNDSAKDRLQRFQRFMIDTTERDAFTAEQAFAATLAELRELAFVTSARSAALAALKAEAARLGGAAESLLAKLEEQRDGILAYLTGREEAPEDLPAVDVPEKVKALAADLHARAVVTDVAGFQATLASATAEKTELQANVRLCESAAKLKAEVTRRRELAALKAARTAADTNGITQKASALTREYATKKILDQFTRETDRLKLQQVTLEDLGGRKGQLNQRPGLLGAVKGTAARMVLSEGEQTALGLAGFFTEAVFDVSKSAIIFDDPVTSLDHVRRDKVAERLAQLAVDRQVVVFTHDVVFTGDLSAAAGSESVAVTERAIERRGSKPGICVPAFPWKAKDFNSRIDHLRTELAKLTKERPNLLQEEYEERVASWAGYLSETWERSVTTEIMNQVFDRGSSQVRMLKFRMLVKITDADDQDLQDGYGATSKWARRHDKAGETNYVAPEPADLELELSRLVQWQKRVKNYLRLNPPSS